MSVCKWGEMTDGSIFDAKIWPRLAAAAVNARKHTLLPVHIVYIEASQQQKRLFCAIDSAFQSHYIYIHIEYIHIYSYRIYSYI